MIVDMAKVTVIMLGSHANEALRELRKLGVLHIKHMREPNADAIVATEHKLNRLNSASLLIGGIDSNQEKLDDAMHGACIKEILSLGKHKKWLNKRLSQLESRLEWLSEWGNVNNALVERLKDSGVYLKLYICNKKSFKTISKDKLICILERKKNQIKLALMSTSEDDSLDFDEVSLPNENKQAAFRKVAVIKSELARVSLEIKNQAKFRDCLLNYKSKLTKRLEFYKTRFGMKHDDKLWCLKGFVPIEKIKILKNAASKNGWAVAIEEPDDYREVPTLIRYPKWVKAIEPVFKFIDVVPGYKEYDISTWFLLFFSIFFAMLIGDAGYGFVFLVGTLLAQKKLPKVPKTPFILMYILSTSTIVWGAMTGTWFGAEGIAKIPFFSNLIVGKIYAYNLESQSVLMYLCFVIGGVQLTIAHAMAAFRSINSRIAIAQLGWISIIWGIFFLAKKLVLGNPFPVQAKYLLSVGMLLVLLFSSKNRNIIKGVLLTLAEFPLKFISCFGDTLSYIRLFAVGYASMMIAVSFNEIALSVGFNSVLTGLISALILVLAHAFNIVLGLMSILVHGIRLNMLEFSGHLDMEWSGKTYAPFKE